MDRNQETRIVKDALKNAGIRAQVKHGRGTAWGWIDINIGEASKRGGVNPETRQYTREEQALHEKVIKIAQQVTGRRGEYGGNICLLAQGEV